MTKAHETTPARETARELSEQQLSVVSGGKAQPVLMKSCARGVHFSNATITH